MVLGTLPKGKHELHQAPHLQLQPWRDKHLGRARQGRRGAGDQRASPRRGIHRLRLEGPEAVGWIWSLADFTQPMSLEVCWPECPHRAGRTRVPSKGHENVCACAGATEPRACASLQGEGLHPSISPISSWPVPGKGQRAAALCVFWFGGGRGGCFHFFFFFWFQSMRSLGSQGC